MSWRGEKVNVHFIDVDGKVAGSLSCIEEEQDAPGTTDFADFGGGLNGSKHVAGMGDDNEQRVRRDSGGDVGGTHKAGGRIGLDAGPRDAILLKIANRTQD